MGGSRRKLKRHRSKVRVALPKKKPSVFKPAFSIPEPLLLSSLNDDGKRELDDAGSVIRNYWSFGVVPNPNLLGVRARTPQIVQCSSLQLPKHREGEEGNQEGLEFYDMESDSDLESFDLNASLEKTAPLRSLTTVQPLHVGRLIEKCGDN